MECPNRESNLRDCTCTYPGCGRKGMCCLCVKYHRQRGELPGCFFPKDVEKTFDRSAEKFAKTMKKMRW